MLEYENVNFSVMFYVCEIKSMTKFWKFLIHCSPYTFPIIYYVDNISKFSEEETKCSTKTQIDRDIEEIISEETKDDINSESKDMQ